jgi:hypothetical protein
MPTVVAGAVNSPKPDHLRVPCVCVCRVMMGHCRRIQTTPTQKRTRPPSWRARRGARVPQSPRRSRAPTTTSTGSCSPGCIFGHLARYLTVVVVVVVSAATLPFRCSGVGQSSLASPPNAARHLLRLASDTEGVSRVRGQEFWWSHLL